MLLDGREQKSLITTTSQQQQQQQRFSYSNPAFLSGLLQYPSLPELGRKLFSSGKPRQSRERAILKNGDCNIRHTHLSKLGMRYLHDIFTSMVDIQWRWTLMIFALAYFVSWLSFALIWWLIMFTHGDLEDEHLPQNQAESGWTPCVLNIQNFTSCYLFSIENQYTIGYGVRVITEECPQAIFILSMQSIIGMTIDAFFIGIVFAKMTRPKLRTQTLLFSRNAVVSKHDGDLCLTFRVGDMRKSPLIGASVKAQLIKPKKTREGEFIKNYRTDLALTVDGGDSIVLLLWPMNIIHKIDEDSPLYHYSASDFLHEKLEIVIVLEGTVESTGQSIQARSSYVSNEILWGYKFEPVVDHLKHDDAYDVNYSRFDSVYPVETSLCSAAKMEEVDGAQAGPVPAPENFNSQSQMNSFDDDDDDDYEQVVQRPPPPAPRKQSFPNMRGYEGREENRPLQYTSSYV